MPLPDLIVLFCLAAAAPASWMVLRRRGARGARLLAASWVAFYGAVLVVTMTAHLVDVLVRLSVGYGHDGAVFPFDFRAYSLLLLGALLVAAGVDLLRGVGRVGGRAGAETRELRRTTLLVLVVVVPLIPIHSFFAAPLAALGALTWLVAHWAGPMGSPS